MDCKVGVHLGKATSVRYSESYKPTYGFDALGISRGNAWEPDANGCAELQHFLMLHRTHELRVLADNVEKFAADVGFPHSFPVHDDDEGGDISYRKSTFFNSDVGTPDPEQEIETLPEALIEKLKTF
jgi:hypothetical protein